MKFLLEGYDISKVPQQELIAAAATAPSLHTLGSTKIARVSRNLVIKKCPQLLPAEAEAMRLVTQKTSIRIPKIYRYFNIYGTGGIYNSTGYIVMDYVKGTLLSNCWRDLVLNQRENIVHQVADMI